MSRVAIIHPWFPQYRLTVFRELVTRAAAQGIEVSVFYGDPPPEWSERGDSVSAEYATRLPTRFVRVGKRSLGLKSLTPLRKSGKYDLIIIEQAIRNLESYLLLATIPKRRLAWWGHGRTYTASKPNWEERLKATVTRRGGWFFAYTTGGARSVIDAGFPSQNVTVVNNSTDTTQLGDALTAITSDQLRRFVSLHKLTDHTTVFIGGLDDSKRITFLLRAAEMVADQLSTFRLLIIGSGVLRESVESFAQENPWCVYMGSNFGDQRALALVASRCILMPGRVGLVAVDSFTARRPIVTTDWPFHAPEFEYLTDGVNAIVAADSIEKYADAVLSTLTDELLLLRLMDGCQDASDIYSAEAMAENLLVGIQSALLRSDEPA